MNQTWRTRYLTAWLLIGIISYSVRSNNCKRDSIWHSYMKLSLNYSHVHQAHCTSIYGAIYKLKWWKSQLQVGNWMETSYRHLESGEPHINTLILKRKPNHTSVHHRECTQSKTITVAVQNLWKLRKAQKKKKETLAVMKTDSITSLFDQHTTVSTEFKLAFAFIWIKPGINSDHSSRPWKMLLNKLSFLFTKGK